MAKRREEDHLYFFYLPSWSPFPPLSSFLSYVISLLLLPYAISPSPPFPFLSLLFFSFLLLLIHPSAIPSPPFPSISLPTFSLIFLSLASHPRSLSESIYFLPPSLSTSSAFLQTTQEWGQVLQNQTDERDKQGLTYELGYWLVDLRKDLWI